MKITFPIILDHSYISSKLLLIGTLFLICCQSSNQKAPAPTPPSPEAVKSNALFELDESVKSISTLKIDTTEQKIYVYKDNQQVGWSYVASGISSFPTPTGDFKILEKIVDKKSNLYGKAYTSEGKLTNSDFKVGRDSVPEGGRVDFAPMKYFMRLTGDGVGMHIGSIPRPGRPASHGCIRLPSAFAPKLFARTAIGTPVAIVGKGPNYSSYLAQTRKKEAAIAQKKAAAAAKAAAEAPASTPITPSPAVETTPATPSAPIVNTPIPSTEVSAPPTSTPNPITPGN
jgi:lipoprotein-anchoring transpeptidase ErfK/SrfK